MILNLSQLSFRNTVAVTTVDVLLVGLKGVLTGRGGTLYPFSSDLLRLRRLHDRSALGAARLLLLAQF